MVAAFYNLLPIFALLLCSHCSAASPAPADSIATTCETQVQMASKLLGKTAVVFGGTSGIGLNTVIQLAERGVKVTAVSRNPEKAAKNIAAAGTTLPESVTLKQCNALDAKAVEAFFETTGPVDILISTATGGSRAFGPFLEMDLEGCVHFACDNYVDTTKMGSCEQC